MKIFIKQKGFFLFFLPLILIGFSLPYLIANNNSTKDKTEVVSSVELNITLGRGPGCTGRGICSLEESTTPGQRIDAKGKVYLNSTNQLTLDIYKQDISVWTKNQQIINNKFKLEDSYTVSSQIMSQLGLSGSQTISVGEYNVSETNNNFVIKF